MRSIWIIAQNTFRESVRSKVLYSLMLFALLLVSISALFGSVTIGDQAKVVKDFGLFSLSIFCTFYVVLSGALLLYKELSRKTIYNILSRAIPRWNFLFGKYLGMLLTATLMLLLMGGGFSLFLLLFESAFDPSLFLAYYAIFLELVIICAAAIFFSSVVVTPMLIGLFTAGIFLAGRSAGFLLYFLSNDTLSAPVRYLLQVLYFVLPHLDMLNVSDAIVYGSLVPAEQIVYGTLYAFGYAGVLLFLSHFLFERRDFS
ncbi:MAG: ABC transporter permease subunit [Bdellovibrionales bacterium]|nr:ABC transporter permease subunit [Bdellovibrionales bacterium]